MWYNILKSENIKREGKMQRYLSIFITFSAVLLLSGCQSKALQMLIEPQELYNYAVTEGVTCTSPEMIDGDVKTRGYTQRTVDSSKLTRQKRRFIGLPSTGLIL